MAQPRITECLQRIALGDVIGGVTGRIHHKGKAFILFEFNTVQYHSVPTGLGEWRAGEGIFGKTNTANDGRSRT